MRLVARRTGLSPHLIRVWERRYAAVTPARTGTNRRLYSDSEVARLVLLREVTGAGHSIGQIAKLADAELHALLRREGVMGLDPDGSNGLNAPVASPDGWHQSDYVAEALACILDFDAQSLEGVLSRAAAKEGHLALLDRVMAALLKEIGEWWQAGRLKVAHEHIASDVIRTFVGNLARTYALSKSAPRLIVTTPAGQLHELGAILAAGAARHQGWRVSYLGPCLPAEEIAQAANKAGAQAVALSLVYPEGDPHLASELTRLRRLLSDGVKLLVGGRAAPAYHGLLRRIGAIQLDDLSTLQNCLDRLSHS